MKKFIIAVVVLGCVAGISVATYLRQTPAISRFDQIPPGGKIKNPRGKNPGNPENAVSDFKRVYPAMVAFRKLHGRLPSLRELLDFERPLAPGHHLREEDFVAADYQYSDRYLPEAENHSYMFAYANERPDGTPKPAFPKPGERDVWLVSDDYTRLNVVTYPDERSARDYRGVYVVLWSDGKIEKIRNADTLHSPTDGGWLLAFPGETGVSKHAQTHAEFYSEDEFNFIFVEGKLVSKPKL
ncbi:MAG: hypothetical protein SFX74_09805 [Fimbriimonadaceae bacterium]|nr:hypothetical protein [Fimbriimonadaceae bacterium]